MNKQFIKKDGLALVNGGYLVNASTQEPVFHKEFVELQKRAEYVITFIQALEGKDLVGKKADSLDAIKKEVTDKLYGEQKISFLSEPTKVDTPTLDALTKEALSFVKNTEDKDRVAKINQFLQEFKLLKEFEDFGLYFEQSDIVKLNKIYTIQDLVEAFSSSNATHVIS